MPPRRKKKAKPLIPESSDTEPDVELPSSGSIYATQKGLFNLPLEILNIVLSEFATIAEEDVIRNSQKLSPDLRQRAIALRALSQVSRGYRAAFLTSLWERLDLCTIENTKTWYSDLTKRHLKRCNGIAKTPRLAKLVKVVTVVLTKHSTDTVLPAFVRCLERLPNLHTFQIVHANSSMTTPLKKAFEGKMFTGVKSVILPSCTHEILRTFPNVTSVTCNEDTGGKLVSAIAAGCPKVQVLRRIEPDSAMLKRIVKGTTNLRELHLIARDSTWESDKVKQIKGVDLKCLSALKSLALIEIDVNAAAKTTEDRVEAATEVLRKNGVKGEKKLVIKRSDWVIPDPTTHEQAGWVLSQTDKITV